MPHDVCFVLDRRHNEIVNSYKLRLVLNKYLKLTFYGGVCFTEYIIFILKADNASLAQRLKDAEDELRNVEHLLDKEEVLERLDELKSDINKKRTAAREPINDQDDLGRALAELHHKYLDLMRDLDRERRKQVCNLFVLTEGRLFLIDIF